MNDTQSLPPASSLRAFGLEVLTFVVAGPLPLSIGAASLFTVAGAASCDSQTVCERVPGQASEVFGIAFLIGVVPAILAGLSFATLHRRAMHPFILIIASAAVAYAVAFLGVEFADWMKLWPSFIGGGSIVGLIANFEASGAAIASLIIIMLTFLRHRKAAKVALD